jgi:hypothetical protein
MVHDADKCGPRADVRQALPEVIVLSTLHHLHAEVSRYGFADLGRIVKCIAPTVLAVELTPSDLASRSESHGKPEYPKAIYPLLDQYPLHLIALEPTEPLRCEILRLAEEEGTRLIAQEPNPLAAFGAFMASVVKFLCSSWASAEAVNAPATDALFEAKHAYQDVLLPGHAQAWKRWNEYFLEQITDAALRYPSERMLVLVGAEHGYWLRARLALDGRLRLLDTSKLLAELESEDARS